MGCPSVAARVLAVSRKISRPCSARLMVATEIPALRSSASRVSPMRFLAAMQWRPSTRTVRDPLMTFPSPESRPTLDSWVDPDRWILARFRETWEDLSRRETGKPSTGTSPLFNGVFGNSGDARAGPTNPTRNPREPIQRWNRSGGRIDPAARGPAPPHQYTTLRETARNHARARSAGNGYSRGGLCDTALTGRAGRRRRGRCRRTPSSPRPRRACLRRA